MVFPLCLWGLEAMVKEYYSPATSGNAAPVGRLYKTPVLTESYGWAVRPIRSGFVVIVNTSLRKLR